MIKSITYVAPHKTALTISLVFAISSLIFIVPMMLTINFMPAIDQKGNPINTNAPLILMVTMPIIYFIFGYIFTGISAWIYNKVAKLTGGVKVEITD